MYIKMYDDNSIPKIRVYSWKGTIQEDGHLGL